MNVDSAKTISKVSLMKTGKTDKTYSIGNHEFLTTVFGEKLAGARPVLVSFEGNPGAVPSKVWFGRSWQGCSNLTTDLSDDANNYFSLAVFKPDKVGNYRRQKTRFQAL